MKVLFVCKLRNLGPYYKIPFGLLNSARFVAEALSKFGIGTKVVDVIDGNFIDKEVYQYKPDFVMLEALWVTPDKIRELLKLHKHVKWVVRIHSKAPFLAMEGIAFEWLNEYKKIAEHHKNFKISANNEDFNDDLNALGFKSIYLPNIYTPPKQHTHKVKDCILDVGCFGAIRPLKNQMLQAVAAVKFADKLDKPLNFHINGDRTEQKGDQVLKNLRALFAPLAPRHKLVEHGWMSHHDFIKLIGRMDVGMQVSLTESFNIVTADFVGQNVPIVVSPDISWMPGIFMADPNSADSMAKKLKFAYITKAIGLQKINRWYLDWYNELAIDEWEDYLGI